MSSGNIVFSNQEFCDKLKELCIEYDTKCGSYPESPLEGYSVYEFCCEKLNIEPVFDHIAGFPIGAV